VRKGRKAAGLDGKMAELSKDVLLCDSFFFEMPAKAQRGKGGVTFFLSFVALRFIFFHLTLRGRRELVRKGGEQPVLP
jgi:hypothetical protein